MRSAPSRPSSTSPCHGQMPNASGFGHGMCQKTPTCASGRACLDHARQQREVIVLHEHDRRRACRRISSSTASANFRFTSPIARPVRSRGTADACARCDRAATGPRSRSRSSSPLLPPASARRGAACTRAGRAARAADRARRRSRDRRRPTRARSTCRRRPASTGSSAVTSPLAGTSSSIALPLCTCMYGSRFDTTKSGRPSSRLAHVGAEPLGGPAGFGRIAQPGLFLGRGPGRLEARHQMEHFLEERLEEPADDQRRPDGGPETVRLQPAHGALELAHDPPPHEQGRHGRDERDLEQHARDRIVPEELKDARAPLAGREHEQHGRPARQNPDDELAIEPHRGFDAWSKGLDVQDRCHFRTRVSRANQHAAAPGRRDPVERTT